MDDAVQKGLRFLRNSQQPDGSFLSNSSPQAAPFTPRYSYHTTFTPALILSALSSIPRAMVVRQKLADFLLLQKSAQWSFNYWDRDSTESKTMPYPDDLDDTFCALSSLWLHDSTYVTEETLAHMTKMLIATEASVGGPYRTWLVSKHGPKIWHDTDVAVNANIAYFLRLAVQSLPNLTSFMESAIAHHAFHSPYYPDFYPTVYYISRAYTGPAQTALVQFLYDKQLPAGHWGTPLHTALAVSALYAMQLPAPQAAHRYLIATQQPGGSWPAEAFSIDPKRDGHVHYGGSEALTTAFVLEALCKKHQPKKQQPTPKRQDAYRNTITKHAVRECRSLALPIRQPLLATLTHVAQGKNGEEVIALAHHFYRGLRQHPQLPPDIIRNVSLANLYGWTAYTLYDDILDNDTDATVLPAANVAMRQSLHYFTQALPDHTDFQAYVRSTFDTMDAANGWEVTRCRFSVQDQRITVGKLPAYGKRQQLAHRSLGHTLAPLGILAAAGISPTAPQAQKLQEALCHYLIAKQLNDDAHDWEEDLRAGHITYVVAHIMRSLDISVGAHNLDELVSQATPQFWYHSLPQICKTISQHIAQSRQDLADSHLLVQNNFLAALLDTLDQVMADTRATITQTESFLKVYRS